MLEAANKDGARKAVVELLHVDETNILEHL
jgi:hypothetical protein